MSGVAVITGAARGQGAEEASLFAAAGWQVVLTDMREADGFAQAAQIGAAALFVPHDVGDPGSWDAVVTAATEHFGGIDVLVNNAAIWRVQSVEQETVADFERILRVNLTGTFLGIRAVIPAMRARGGGSIVNISSIAGMQGIAGHGAYGASKWGVRGLTKSAALELAADGIRVNSVHPGTIDTPMVASVIGAGTIRPNVPLGRVGTSSEVAQLVFFLASGAASYITGAEFVVDGGILAGRAVATR